MQEPPFTVLEPGIGRWRSADIDEDGLPSDLRFHDDPALSPLDAVFAARVTNIDSANDLAFADLGNGLSGVMNLRRAKLLVKGHAQGIKDCVTEGQHLLVQVVAEPQSAEGKALTITPRPRLLGRYVMAEAGQSRLNFSKDLPPKTIKSLESALKPLTADAALIVRSSAVQVPAQAVEQEATVLTKALSAHVEKPGLMFARTPVEKALLAAPQGETPILIEGGSAAAEARQLAAAQWPDLAERLHPYLEAEPAFERFGVEEAIEEALADKIELPSGGWISINETPAMTVIDVNMGSALKGRSASEAKVVVNMEAALAALYHLRFQDIGGLVVIDFIDMSAKGAAKELIDLISKVARTDRVPLQHTGLSQFGLVELARKRSGLSLRDRMQVPAKPRTKAGAAALDLLRRGQKLGRTKEPGALIISGPEPIIAWLKNHTDLVAALEAGTSRKVELLLGAAPDVFLRG